MYNRENFNRGKFNTSSASLAVTGVARLSLTADVGGSLGLSAPQSNAMVQLGMAGSAVRRLNSSGSADAINLDTVAKVTKRLFASQVGAVIAIGLAGTMRRSVFAVSSVTILHLYSTGSGKRRFFAGASAITLTLLTAGNSKRRLFAVETVSTLAVDAKGRGNRHFTAKSDFAPLSLTAKGAVTMLGYATISLPGLVVPIGGDLVIDTEQMTVTLNGDDVTRFFDAESEFFKLKPGDNIVVFEDGQQNRNVSIKILWKDLWL